MSTENIVCLLLGFFLASLIYEIINLFELRQIEKEKLTEIKLIKETISVWGRAMLDLKVKSVKDEERKNNGKENISQSIHTQGLSKRDS